MKLELHDAIEKLYQAFADAPRPKRVDQLDVCPCCVSDEEARPLLHIERRLLTDKELFPYIYTARRSVTGPDYLYFFPRIVELLWIDGMATEPERVFDRLANLGPESWQAEQLSGVAQFFSSLIAEVARMGAEAPDDVSYGWLINEIISCIGLSGLGLRPHLATMLEYPNLVADFYNENAGFETTGRLSSQCWNNYDDSPAWAEVIAWLQSKPVLTLLTASPTTSVCRVGEYSALRPKRSHRQTAGRPDPIDYG